MTTFGLPPRTVTPFVSRREFVMKEVLESLNQFAVQFRKKSLFNSHLLLFVVHTEGIGHDLEDSFQLVNGECWHPISLQNLQVLSRDTFADLGNLQ